MEKKKLLLEIALHLLKKNKLESLEVWPKLERMKIIKMKLSQTILLH